MSTALSTTIKDFKVSVNTMSVKPEDVVIFKFDPNMDEVTIKEAADVLNEQFPDNPVIGITSDIDVMMQYPKDAIKMLEGMINKIKLAHPEAVESKLIV